MWELWGSKFRPSHWLGTSLIQLLVATAQAVIEKITNCCHQISSFKATVHQIWFWLGLRPRPRWGSPQRFSNRPRLQLDLSLGGCISKGGEKRGSGGERKGDEASRNWNFWLRHWESCTHRTVIGWSAASEPAARLEHSNRSESTVQRASLGITSTIEQHPPVLNPSSLFIFFPPVAGPHPNLIH